MGHLHTLYTTHVSCTDSVHCRQPWGTGVSRLSAYWLLSGCFRCLSCQTYSPAPIATNRSNFSEERFTLVHGFSPWLLVSTLETLCQDIRTVSCREIFTLENQQATSKSRGHIPNDLTSSHKVPHFKGPRIHQ